MASRDGKRSGPPRWAVRMGAPLTWALAGRPWFPLWAIVHHRGRRTGTRYAVPVALIPTRSAAAFLIGLPWGASTNWAQNVLAAGGATLTWKGRQVEVRHPQLIGPDVAVQQARPILRSVVGSGRFPAFLQLDRG